MWENKEELTPCGLIVGDKVAGDFVGASVIGEAVEMDGALVDGAKVVGEELDGAKGDADGAPVGFEDGGAAARSNSHNWL